jgi:hypothetical protein
MESSNLEVIVDEIIGNNEVPLIYTSKGNLPISDLTYQHQWLEDDNAITLVEEYRLGDEIVKRNVHARLKRGLATDVQQMIFG